MWSLSGQVPFEERRYSYFTSSSIVFIGIKNFANRAREDLLNRFLEEHSSVDKVQKKVIPLPEEAFFPLNLGIE